MRTTMPVFLVLCMAVVGLMFAGSGFNDVMGISDRTGAAADELQGQANNSSVGNDPDSSQFESDARTDNSGSLVGFVISGASVVWDIGELVIVLPQVLKNIGFPGWFADPFGTITQIIVSIGLIQFASGRVYR